MATLLRQPAATTLACCLATLSLLAPALPTQAEELHLAVYAQRFDLPLRSGAEEMDSRVGRLGLTLTGVYSPHVEASLDLGHANLTQTGNPATQGMRLSGPYLGVALRLWPLRSEYLDAWVQGDYSAQFVRGGITGQEVEIDWYDSGLAAGLVAHLGGLDLHGGTRQGSLRGDEIATGVRTYTRGVDLADKTSAWVGMDLYVSQGETIGVVFEDGARRGLAVRFSKRF